MNWPEAVWKMFDEAMLVAICAIICITIVKYTKADK